MSTPAEPTSETTETPNPSATPPIEPPTEDPKSLLSGAEDAPKEEAAPEDEEKSPTEPEVVEPITAESLTFPEGVTLDDELLSGALGLFNNAELTPTERMQQLLDLQIGASTKAADAATEAGQALWNETQTTWQKEAQALPEIGGDKLDATLATIKNGLTEVGATKETFAALDLTGAGNHPELIRILHALTVNLAEGGPVTGTPPSGPISNADKMFGTK